MITQKELRNLVKECFKAVSQKNVNALRVNLAAFFKIFEDKENVIDAEEDEAEESGSDKDGILNEEQYSITEASHIWEEKVHYQTLINAACRSNNVEIIQAVLAYGPPLYQSTESSLYGNHPILPLVAALCNATEIDVIKIIVDAMGDLSFFNTYSTKIGDLPNDTHPWFAVTGFEDTKLAQSIIDLFIEHGLERSSLELFQSHYPLNRAGEDTKHIGAAEEHKD